MAIHEALQQGPDAEVILAHVLKNDRAWLFANPDFELSRLQLTTYNLLLARSAKHWPVAYLTGHKEFYGLEFRVTPDVLIPRPETEMLVELARERIENRELRIKKIIDLGTGGGAIIISLAKSLRNSKLKFSATDISPKALQNAKQNARRHGVEKRIKFIKSDLLRNLKFDIRNSLLVSNLPYLTPAQVKANPDLKHEPRSALVAGPDGLKYYRKLFEQLSKFYIQNSIFLLEHDPSQKNKLAALVKKSLPNSRTKFHRDFSGRWRICEIYSNRVQ